MFSKVKVSAVMTEGIGAFILTLAILTISKSTLNLPFFVSATAGLVAAGMMLLFGRVSGAQLNPLVTAGLLSTKKISVIRAAVYMLTQLIGGFVAYYLFAYLSGQKWHSAAQFSAKLLVAEALGAFIFSLGWATVVYQKLEAAKAASVLGLTLAMSMLALSSAGAVMFNPAVDLGLRAFTWGGSVFGPLVGAVAGFQVYKYLFTDQVSHSNAIKTDKNLTQKVVAQVHRLKVSR